MKYFKINTLGDDQNDKLTFIDNGIENIGLKSYLLWKGKSIIKHLPKNPSIYLNKDLSGLQLCSFIGNTKSYLVVETKMKDVILEYRKEKMEIFSFTLYNHKKRVHSTDYWIVNPLETFDCLNRIASDFAYYDDGRIMHVKTFVFDPEKLQHAPNLFRIPEMPYRFFISQVLAKAFQKHEFTNIYLTEIEQQEQSE